MKRLFLIIVVLSCFFPVKSQDTTLFETETHIFWNAERKVTKDDFQGDGLALEDKLHYCEKYGMCTIAYLGVWTVLDIPNKKLQKKGIMEEKIYVVPAFEKSTSYILNNDTLGVEQQQLMFDIFELSARMLRAQLQEYQDAVDGATGMKSIMFMTAKENVEELRDTMSSAFTHNVLMYKTEDISEWRELIDGLLEKYQNFATSDDDYKRFITDAPILKGYERAEYLYPSMNKKEETVE